MPRISRQDLEKELADAKANLAKVREVHSGGAEDLKRKVADLEERLAAAEGRECPSCGAGVKDGTWKAGKEEPVAKDKKDKPEKDDKGEPKKGKEKDAEKEDEDEGEDDSLTIL